MDEKLWKREERAVFALRSLYRRYGYLPFRMSRFEEYELYIRNKDFLVSDRIITFNDTDGKLLALKPDVTLSIIKSGEDVRGFKQRVYYNENVYRVSGSARQYKEIMQAGLECIGDIDLYDIYEVIALGAESLSTLSDSFVLNLSHLGLLTAVFDNICPDREFAESALHFISEKNTHDLENLCRQYGAEGSRAKILTAFASVYGERGKVIRTLEEICVDLTALPRQQADQRPEGKTRQHRPVHEMLNEIKTLSGMLDRLPFQEKIHFDFSVVNDMNYYSGFVFEGFLNGICDSILSGGQYDKLMAKMGRTSGAIGFALYLDLLEQLEQERTDHDVDVLLLYDDGVDFAEVAETVGKLVREGRTVSAQKEISGKLRCRAMVDLRKGEGSC